MFSCLPILDFNPSAYLSIYLIRYFLPKLIYLRDFLTIHSFIHSFILVVLAILASTVTVFVLVLERPLSSPFVRVEGCLLLGKIGR